MRKDYVCLVLYSLALGVFLQAQHYFNSGLGYYLQNKIIFSIVYFPLILCAAYYLLGGYLNRIFLDNKRANRIAFRVLLFSSTLLLFQPAIGFLFFFTASLTYLSVVLTKASAEKEVRERLKSTLRSSLPILFILLCAFLVLLCEVKEDFNIFAIPEALILNTRNLLRYGFGKTLLARTYNMGLNDSPIVVMFNHPPGPPLIAVNAYLFFGDILHEWHYRIFSIVMSLMSITVLYLFVKRVWNKRSALIASAVLLLTPLFSSLGREPVYGPYLLFFGMLAIYFYMEWLSSDRNAFLIYLFFTIAIVMDWHGLWVPLGIYVHYLITRRGSYNKKFLFTLPCVAIACILCLFQLTAMVRNTNIIGMMLDIKSAARERAVELNWSRFFSIMSQFYPYYFTYTLVSFLFLWPCTFAYHLRKKNTVRVERNMWVLLLFIWGATGPLLLKSGACRHSWYHFYMAPFFAVFAAELFDSAWEFIGKKNLGKIVKSGYWVVLAGFFLIQIMLFKNHFKWLASENYWFPLEVSIKSAKYIHNKTKARDVIAANFENDWYNIDGAYIDRKTVVCKTMEELFSALKEEKPAYYIYTTKVVFGRPSMTKNDYKIDSELKAYLLNNYSVYNLDNTTFMFDMRSRISGEEGVFRENSGEVFVEEDTFITPPFPFWERYFSSIERPSEQESFNVRMSFTWLPFGSSVPPITLELENPNGNTRILCKLSDFPLYPENQLIPGRLYTTQYVLNIPTGNAESYLPGTYKIYLTNELGSKELASFSVT